MLLKANTKIELSDLTHTNQRHYPALNSTNNLKDTIKQEAKAKVGGLWHILHSSLVLQSHIGDIHSGSV